MNNEFNSGYSFQSWPSYRFGHDNDDNDREQFCSLFNIFPKGLKRHETAENSAAVMYD